MVVVGNAQRDTPTSNAVSNIGAVSRREPDQLDH
jgi:hypothetical protein